MILKNEANQQLLEAIVGAMDQQEKFTEQNILEFVQQNTSFALYSTTLLKEYIEATCVLLIHKKLLQQEGLYYSKIHILEGI